MLLRKVKNIFIYKKIYIKFLKESLKNQGLNLFGDDEEEDFDKMEEEDLAFKYK